MSQPRPNLFIIGAMKCGTSSLHAYLGSHPKIFMSTPKEPMFFSRGSNGSKGLRSYLEMFASVSDATIIGESSTEYSKVPKFSGVAERIYSFNPEARFIYIMRDPIDRTISQYWHMFRSEREKRPMLAALRRDPEYINNSHYAMQLTPYVELFGKDRVYTLTLEEMTKDPSKTVEKIFGWLGVDSSFDPPSLEKRKHVTPSVVAQKRGLGLLSFFCDSSMWQTMWRTLKPSTPKSIRLLGRRLLVKEIDRASTPVEKVVEFLRPIQGEQTRALSTMLNRDFPEWTTLCGSDGSEIHS